MLPQAINIIYYTLLVLGGIFAVYGIYFVVTSLFGFKKQKPAPTALPRTRFAVLVAARNEQAVIGQLVDSLKQQKYPAHLFDLYVAPNNCTDHTEDVARAHGAKIFTAKGTITGKGEVVNQFTSWMLESGKYDAMCIFDADNLVHPDFLQKMNDAHQNGAQVAQGFRDSKNPTDSAVSTCYSVSYWIVNRFYNGGRRALGLSALVNGSGFMASCQLLEELGGWNTHTMTEDYEFSAQCVLKGYNVQYVQDAIIYDEQPLTFAQSWKQRRRWSTGSVQSMNAHLSQLVKTGIKDKNMACIDMAIMFFSPLAQFISLLLGALTAGLGLYRLATLHPSMIIPFLLAAAGTALAAYLVCTLAAAFVVRLNRDTMQGTTRGAMFFAFFILSCIPIGIISLFKKQKTWDAIAHTRSVSLSEVA